MNNLLTHYPINWIDGMKLSSRTHSYYSRHELKSLNTWKRVCDSRQQGVKIILKEREVEESNWNNNNIGKTKWTGKL